jgi:hypothetical protein
MLMGLRGSWRPSGVREMVRGRETTSFCREDGSLEHVKYAHTTIAFSSNFAETKYVVYQKHPSDELCLLFLLLWLLLLDTACCRSSRRYRRSTRPSHWFNLFMSNRRQCLRRCRTLSILHLFHQREIQRLEPIEEYRRICLELETLSRSCCQSSA